MRVVFLLCVRCRLERQVVRINEKEAMFRLKHNGRWLRIHDVNDVSISGIGLRFAEAIDAGTPIKICFMSRDLEVVLGAKVCWCHACTQDVSIAGTTGGYRVGVEFDPQRLDDSMLMFMALRKYLDPFT